MGGGVGWEGGGVGGRWGGREVWWEGGGVGGRWGGGGGREGGGVGERWGVNGEPSMCWVKIWFSDTLCDRYSSPSCRDTLASSIAFLRPEFDWQV